MDIGNQLADFFFPIVHCRVCGGKGLKEHRGLCQHCLEELLASTVKLHFCATCLNFYSAHFRRCPNCFGKTTRHYYREGDAFVPYEGVGAALVKALKYRNSRYLAQTMAELMLAFRDIGSEGTYALLVPVPSHRTHQRERGYNQAALLAESMGKLAKIPVVPKALVKTKDVPSQTTLKGRERRQNVVDAFAIADAEAVANKCVILVDDTITTGTTVNECAKVLRKAGAKQIKVVAFAANSLQ